PKNKPMPRKVRTRSKLIRHTKEKSKRLRGKTKPNYKTAPKNKPILNE
ncbi:35094_t:CDS:1, partial [Racocetra persica]